MARKVRILFKDGTNMDCDNVQTLTWTTSLIVVVYDRGKERYVTQWEVVKRIHETGLK